MFSNQNYRIYSNQKEGRGRGKGRGRGSRGGPIRNFFCFIYVFTYVLYTFWVLVYVLGTFWVRNCAIFSTSKKFRKHKKYKFHEFFLGNENYTITYPKLTKNEYHYITLIYNLC